MCYYEWAWPWRPAEGIGAGVQAWQRDEPEAGGSSVAKIFSSSSFLMTSPSRAVCTAAATLSEMSSPLSSFSTKQEEMPSKTEVSVDVTGGENIALLRELNPSWESCSSSVSLSDIACGRSRGGGDWRSAGRDGPGSN